VVIRNGAQPDDDYDWIVVDDQPPQKARILLMLAMLGNPDERLALQAAFYRF
jgi:glutamin-(asparagin-)ase